MSTINYKSKFANKASVKSNWYIVDVDGEILGRMASKIAMIIRGKNKPDFTPHVNTGDKVIILNAEKIRLTGKKLTDKKYIRHTGYPGGDRVRSPKDILEKNPPELIRIAVKGMLPKNKLQKEYLKNLHIYTGPEHPHTAQKPQEIEI